MPDLTLNIELTEEMHRLMMAPRSTTAYTWHEIGGTPKMSPISTTPASALADLVRQLGKDGADLSGVKKSFDALEAEKKQKIEKALDGLAEMATIEKPKTRRFVLVYFSGDKSHILQGIAYEGAEAHDADEEDTYKVHVQIDGGPICDGYTSMKALRRNLADNQFPFRIRYID